MGNRKERIVLAISLIGFLLICAVAYSIDLRSVGSAQAYEFRLPPSGKYNPSEGAITRVYPTSTYDIDVGELKAVNQFNSKIKFSQIAFLGIDNHEPSHDDREIRDIRLRFYFSSLANDKKPPVVDTVVPIIEKPINYLELDLEKQPPKDFVWTANENSAVFYPFDRYVLGLHVEEQVDIPGAVTNTPPESFNVRVTNPRFIASKVVRSSAGGLDIGFVVLQRPWLLRILAVCLLIVSLVFVSFLFTLKTPKEFLPGSLGYIAGVWGMRNIISSDAPVFPTITDYLAMVLLGVVALLIVVKLLLLRKTENEVADSRA
jgi:hypothetical protein